MRRKNGISVLLACQNEEALIALCIRSFIDFGDELIVVDNGSTDRTREIVLQCMERYPKKIKFFEAPELTDLPQCRQFAFERSSFRWVVRADGDFVAYTDGEYNILNFRELLLAQRRSIVPKFYSFSMPNLFGDFWHTGLERDVRSLSPDDPGRYVPPPVSAPTMRIYQVFPTLKFARFGRWEGIRFQRMLRRLRIELDHPLWMHCNIKSERSYFLRSERTNWREQGDFKRYPSLESYLKEAIVRKYDTEDIDEATSKYLAENVYPFLQDYDPTRYYAYPTLVKEQMERHCIYRIHREGASLHREYYGIDPLLSETRSRPRTITQHDV